MKITKVVTHILRIPEDDPLANMPEEAGRRRPVVTCGSRPTTGSRASGLTFYGGE